MEYNEITRKEASTQICSVSFKRKHHQVSFTPLNLPRTLPPFIKEVDIQSTNNQRYKKIRSSFSTAFLPYLSNAYDDLIINLKNKNLPTQPPSERRRGEDENNQDQDHSNEFIQSLTSTKDIQNFYEYTKMCLEKAKQLPYEDVNELSTMYIEVPENRANKKIAIFDLDETLIHCEIKNYKDAENIIEIKLPSNKRVKVGINLRPHCVESLKKIKEKYYLISFTASQQAYADSVLNFIDPKNEIFSMRLYRHNCRRFKIEDEDIYVKDLRIFKNVPLTDVVIIDNSLLSFGFHLKNGIPIVPYYNGINDSELDFLTSFLLTIAEEKDLREKIESHIKRLYDEL